MIMTSREAQLAALARRAQWLLDQAAFDLPDGRCTREDRDQLAGLLDDLAAALRAVPAHEVIDGVISRSGR